MYAIERKQFLDGIGNRTNPFDLQVVSAETARRQCIFYIVTASSVTKAGSYLFYLVYCSVEAREVFAHIPNHLIRRHCIVYSKGFVPLLLSFIQYRM